jgi:hypothetical protein
MKATMTRGNQYLIPLQNTITMIPLSIEILITIANRELWEATIQGEVDRQLMIC